jgi:rRNA biogenesis protein RRP5
VEPELVNSSIPLDDVTSKSLLQVSVTSIEDHGLIVSFGHDEFTGFIKRSALGHYNVDNIREGQVFLASVIHRPKNKVIQMSLDLKSTQTPINDVGDISSFLPGDTVQFLISEVRAAGAGGKVMGMLDATIDQFHIGSAKISENKTVTARITAVLPSADPRKATLSVLPHLLRLDRAKTASGQSPLEALPVGFILETVKVIEVLEDQGVYVDIGLDGVRGFVHALSLWVH